MQLLVNWLANLLAVEKTTFVFMAVLCSGGALLIRSMLENQLMALVFYPIFMLLSLLFLTGLQLFDVFPAHSAQDWFKPALISTICGNGLGVIVAVFLLQGVEDATAKLETMDTRKPRSKGRSQDRLAAIKHGSPRRA
jgi:hypothetical protein